MRERERESERRGGRREKGEESREKKEEKKGTNQTGQPKISETSSVPELPDSRTPSFSGNLIDSASPLLPK